MMVNLWQTFMSFSVLTLFFLIVNELYVAVPNTLKMYYLLRRLDNVIKVSERLISTGIEDTLKREDVLKLKTSTGICLIEKKAELMVIDGFSLNFGKNLPSQIIPKIDELSRIIYKTARRMFFTNSMIKWCERMKDTINELQRTLDCKNMKGVC